MQPKLQFSQMKIIPFNFCNCITSSSVPYTLWMHLLCHLRSEWLVLYVSVISLEMYYLWCLGRCALLHYWICRAITISGRNIGTPKTSSSQRGCSAGTEINFAVLKFIFFNIPCSDLYEKDTLYYVSQTWTNKINIKLVFLLCWLKQKLTPQK